ncbi:MAG: phosphoglucomutase (alpha-D-glucose-1,6-bisphosphate-dependent) [Verrucomicrobia bacterium]|nr:phosphoglucomutase (alpha-D-glucose-1,6-bisphosphate-dependent) [Verrucomicrobiota bacterium]
MVTNIHPLAGQAATTNLHPLAGKPATADLLIDVSKLKSEYFERKPDPHEPAQRVSFGTSGHRGTPTDGTFTEAHILAITQAICDYRQRHNINGPLFMGKDTHALSGPAQRTALKVLAANGITTFIQRDDGFTPTPALSLSILNHNRGRNDGLADGIGITPSHNPPADGGFKYNPPNGGPADTYVTGWIQRRANRLLRHDNSEVKRMPLRNALRAATTRHHDFCAPYVAALGSVLDMDAIRRNGVKIGVDPLGGASVHYWEPIKARYGLDLTVVNPNVDPTFKFMSVDHDGKIRMDCSSPYAMASLVELKGEYDVAFGCDPDADRHGIVSPTVGLMNPNHYLAVAINYLLRNRQWHVTAFIGKTVVSSSLIDLVVAKLGRRLCEVPVGFKYFVNGLYDGSLCFGGEESAGASFLRRDGTTWVTEKDGLLLGLLAAEIVAHVGTLAHQYLDLADKLGTPVYTRIDTPCMPEQMAAFKKLTPDSVAATELAGETITAKLLNAPGNNAPIGGLKVVTANGWFAARPSGTENLYKLYAESFKSQAHLDAVVVEAQQLVSKALS